MKKFALAAAFAVVFIVPVKADVVDYAELYGGVTQDPDLGAPPPNEFEMDVGFNVGGALGWNLSPLFSVEVDFFYTDSDFKGFDESVESFSAMVNGFYHIDMGSSWRPYVGAGAGVVQVKETDRVLNDSDTDSVFGYQAMVGVLRNVDNNIDWLVEYRYQGAEDATVSVPTPFTQEYSSHNLSTGFRINIQ